ncbi:MAG: glycosyltransferase N-terminal domain-containing protein [Elusimicrobiota bacterium]|jgi:3-deoxy-D-manno-octulosonic-acid transferase
MIALLVLAVLNLLAPIVALGVVLSFVFSPRRGLLRDLPEELGQRLGGLPEAARAALAGRKVLWLHAASAGEVSAVDEMMRLIHSRPDAPAILVTTTTRAGRDAAQRLPQVTAAVLAPIDCWPAVSRFLAAAKPYALILVETELWPNMIELSHQAGVRVALVNGRISDRSFPRYKMAAGLLQPFLARLRKVAAQTPLDGERFCALGAQPAAVLAAGNMKYDRLAAASRGRGRLELDRLGWHGCPVLAAGSTHPGEEKQILDAFVALRRDHPRLRLVLAPRHVERADDAAQTVRAHGLVLARLSLQDAPADSSVLLVDAMGWLGDFYSCALAGFVGGTLVPVGGHNLLEPALARVPVVFGPHIAHTRDTAAALQKQGGGFMVDGAPGLARILKGMLDEPETAQAFGRQALQTAQSLQGATARTLAHLADLIAPPSQPE